jgi:hypothetical protein
MAGVIKAQQERLKRDKLASAISTEAQKAINRVIAALEDQQALLLKSSGKKDGAVQVIQKDFDQRVKKLTQDAEAAGKKLTNLLNFYEEVYGEGQELLILVTELTMNYHAAHFISRFGSESYFKHNKELMFYERQKELILEIEQLNLDGTEIVDS